MYIDSQVGCIKRAMEREPSVRKICVKYAQEVVHYVDGATVLVRFAQFQKIYQQAVREFKEEALISIKKTRIVLGSYSMRIVWETFLDMLYLHIMKLMVYQERPDYLLLGMIENRRRNLSRTRRARLAIIEGSQEWGRW